MARTENYVRELFLILFKQKNLIFWTAFLIFAGAALVAAYWPPTYQATGSVLVSEKQLTAQTQEAMRTPEVRPVEITKEDLASEVEILRSPDVIKNTVRQLALSNRSFASALEGGEPSAEALYQISRNLTTTVIPASSVISLEYLGSDPLTGVDVLNTLMEQYIVHRQKFFALGEPALNSGDLSGQEEHYREALQKNEDELTRLVTTSGVSAPEVEIESNILLEKKLEEELHLLRNAHVDVRTRLERLDNALAIRDTQYFSFLDNALIRELAIRLADLSIERDNKARDFLPESAVVSRIDEQIHKTFAALKNEVNLYRADIERQMNAIDEKVKNLESAVAAYGTRNVKLERQIIAINRIKRDTSLLENSLQMLSQRRGEVEVNELSRTGNAVTRYAAILSRAFPSEGPVFPRPGVIIPLGLLVGILSGFSLGFLREYFDHTFKNPGDVQAYTGMPVIFSLSRPHNNFLSFIYIFVICGLSLAMVGFVIWQFLLKGSGI